MRGHRDPPHTKHKEPMPDTAKPRIYLAGPDVFRTVAVEVGLAKKDMCSHYGFGGVFPMDPVPGVT